MVQGLSEMNRRWSAIPNAVQSAVKEAMERAADAVVADMNASVPIPDILVGWTWGDPPAGAVILGGSEGPSGRLRVTFYATAVTTKEGAFPAVARWFEFGTSERRTKKGVSRGRIVAQPYFYPVWRVWKRRVRSRITRAMNKAIKEAL